MNAIYTRRSVRQFKDVEVEAKKIEQLLKAGMQAPSAMNQQCWEFIVVTGRDHLEKLSGFKDRAVPLSTATVGIVILGNTERMKNESAYQQDLGAVTQNISLEAVNLDLGTVWLGAAPNVERMEYIRELYNLPDTLLPYSVLAVGYPMQEGANKFVDRFDASRITYIK